ncbi:Tyrosine recombinase XerD [subsurface metagenome]
MPLLRREIKYLKKEEWLRLIESVDNYRDKLIVKLLYSTGMRVGELAKLKVEDIDFQERFIRIPAENTKTNTARTIIVPKEVLSDISAYLRIARISPRTNKGRLFNLTVRRMQQLVKEYAKRANIEATPHTLRHTHIVHALLDRIPITAVQKQVGHKRLATTQIYSNLAPEQVREAYEKT